MNHYFIPVALLLALYIGYRTKIIQDSLTAAQSVVQNGPDIPKVQVELDTQFTDPSTVYRLINGGTETVDTPGAYGVLQRNHIDANGNQMPTYGTNYSKSFT